jgi:hypothetical protein
MTRFRRFARLAPCERRVLVSTVVWLGVVQLALAIRPWRVSIAIIGLVRRLCPAIRSDEAQIVWAVRAAAGILPRTTCLARALTLHALLTNNGLPATIEIGVARDAAGQLVSHAWVERDGVPLLDTAEGVAGYARVPIPQLPSHFFRSLGGHRPSPV